MIPLSRTILTETNKAMGVEEEGGEEEEEVGRAGRSRGEKSRKRDRRKKEDRGAVG